MSRGDLTEAEWRVLKDLLPIEAANRGRGRPPEQNRSIVNGILWNLLNLGVALWLLGQPRRLATAGARP